MVLGLGNRSKEYAEHTFQQNFSARQIQIGKLNGQVYAPKTNTGKGAIVVHGFMGNRWGMHNLSLELAEYGYKTISLDLPQHYTNNTQFTLGNIADSIDEAKIFLEHAGCNNIAVLGHSMGGVGAIFHSCGYSSALERELFELWNHMLQLATEMANAPREGLQERYMQEITTTYDMIKRLILEGLKNNTRITNTIRCYVLLAPPQDLKKALPGGSLLRRLPSGIVKRITNVVHNSTVKVLNKEIKQGMMPNIKPTYNKDKKAVNLQFFETKNSKEFLDYFLNISEPDDFVELLEDLAIRFKTHDSKTTFFEYYLANYVKSKPKLFVYGTFDHFLMPFIPGKRKTIEARYRSFSNNAEIFTGKFSHWLTNKPIQTNAAASVTNDLVLARIISFVENHTHSMLR